MTSPELTARDIAHAWLSLYEHCVRGRNYDQAKHLFHERLVWFGLESTVTATIEQTIEREFKQLWPNQLAFTMDMGRAAIIPCTEAILVALPWTCRGIIAGSPPKQGRLTVLIGVFEDRKTLALHGHMSINPI